MKTRGVAVYLVIILTVFLSGCSSVPEYGYTAKTKNTKLFYFHANEEAMREIGNSGSLNVCHYKDKCIGVVTDLIAKLVSEDKELRERCSNGFKVLDETMLFDDKVIAHVQFTCE